MYTWRHFEIHLLIDKTVLIYVIAISGKTLTFTIIFLDVYI